MAKRGILVCENIKYKNIITKYITWSTLDGWLEHLHQISSDLFTK